MTTDTTIKYPSIGQFKNVIRTVTDRVRYAGKDENDTPIFNQKPLPTITFTGTVKIHGTNAGIRFTPEDGNGGVMVAQSRERDLSILSDNAGFCAFVFKNEKFFRQMCENFVESNDSIVIYGEWCGKNIQASVAVSQLDKMFVIFGIRVIKNEEETWITDLSTVFGVDYAMSYLHEHGVYLIDEFPTYEVTIDFNRPVESQNKLVELTIAVEDECPVGKHFGVSGIGEGIVFKHNSPDYGYLAFKCKGEKHSNSKVKTIAPVDEEAFKAAKEFAETYVTTSRLEQGIHVMKAEKQLEPIDRNVGDFLRWITSDIIREEQNAIVSNDLCPKKIAKEISNLARKWYFEQI